jgi:elongation factor Ts
MEFVKEAASTIIEQNPKDVDTLLTLKGKGSDLTIKELLDEKIQMIGENIKIRRFVRTEGDVVSYIHGGGRIGVIVKFDTDLADKDEFQEYAKNIAMQVAAINPPYLDKESVPAAAVEEEKKVLTAQAMNEGKPREIAEKIVMGRMGKFYKEQCLTEQEYVKDSSLTVNKYTAQVAKELGGKIKITGFVRYEKGEGLEKRHDDLAAEIAGMVK